MIPLIRNRPLEGGDAGGSDAKATAPGLQSRIAADRAFAQALLCEGIDTMFSGDFDVGKSILRDYIKATVGFEKLGEATDTPTKSLIRMFGPNGNPQARNLFCVIGYLQQQAGIELHVTPQPR